MGIILEEEKEDKRKVATKEILEDRRKGVVEEIQQDRRHVGIVSNVVILADKEIISAAYFTRLSQRLLAPHS